MVLICYGHSTIMNGIPTRMGSKLTSLFMDWWLSLPQLLNLFIYIYGGFHKWGIPKMVGWYLKILLKIDDLGVPPCQEIPINIWYSFVILMSHERSGPCFFLIHGSNTPSDRPPEGVLHFAWPGRDGLGADGTTCDFRAAWMRMGQIQHGHDEMLSGE